MAPGTILILWGGGGGCELCRADSRVVRKECRGGVKDDLPGAEQEKPSDVMYEITRG